MRRLAPLLALLLGAPAAAGELHDQLRLDWLEQATWSHDLVVASVSAAPDADAVGKRLERHAGAIGADLAPYVGDRVATRLTRLLEEHDTVLGELVDASIQADTPRVEDAKRRWYANAGQIADLLAEADPSDWPVRTTGALLDDQLRLVLDAVDARLAGRYDDEMDAGEKLERASVKLADVLGDGIANQYPGRFPPERPVL